MKFQYLSTVDPMAPSDMIVKFGTISKPLQELHFKEYHEVLFYPEKTLEKMKDHDGFLENFPDRLRNLLFLCLNAVKTIPAKISRKEDRILMDIVKLKCSIPQ